MSPSNESNTSSEEESTANEQKVKVTELSLRNKELNNNRIIEITKIVTTGIVVTLIPAIINAQIQHQKIELERLQGEQKYLESFAERALQDDLVKRVNFAEYISMVAHSEDSRIRWGDYHTTLKTRFTEELAKVETLQEQVVFLKDQLAELLAENATDEEINDLSAQILEAERAVRDLRREAELQTEPVLGTGDTGVTVVSLQERLRELGYFDAPPDGIYGIGTRRAIQEFQRDNEMIVDGIAGPRTLIELGLTPTPNRSGDSEDNE